MPVEVGEKAPDFTLPTDSWEKEVSLEEYTRRGPVVLFFYPGDWSSVCSDQMEVIEDNLPLFEERGARVVAVSVDSPWSHAAWSHARELTIPLFSDFHREVTKRYGMLREEGFPERAYFIIGNGGEILSRRVEAKPTDAPELDVILEDLDRVL